MASPDTAHEESLHFRGRQQSVKASKVETDRVSQTTKLHDKFVTRRQKRSQSESAKFRERQDSNVPTNLSSKSFGHVFSPRSKEQHIDLGKQFVLSPEQAERVNQLNLRELLTQKREGMVKKAVQARLEHLTSNHYKLLYLLSQYTGNDAVNNEWMRRQALQVLVYEGIRMDTFEYDYAPVCQLVDESMIYLNVSQDAEDDLDDLREMLLIKTLLLTTYQHTMTTAVQLLPRGYEVLKKLMGTPLYQDIKSQVDCVIYRNVSGTPAAVNLADHRLHVDFDRYEKSFVIFNAVGFSARSKITDVENVSYVCSPFIPDCLRYAQSMIIKNIPSNWDIARKLADALKTDEDNEIDPTKENRGGRRLQELLKLGGIRACVAEWIPYGRNHLALLNEKLGSGSKVPGGLFTSELDEEPDREVFVSTQDQTGNCLYVMDYEPSTYVNFVAEIFSAIDTKDNLKQVEQFGIHVHFDGTFFYSSVINSVMDRFFGDISFDYLTRVLVDIHQDSNVVSQNLTSPYQYVMLDSVFGGNSSHRPKFNLIMAEEIDPWMSLEKYLDEEEIEMEIQQVIGEVRSAHELAAQIYLFIGKSGMLIIGNSDMILQHEKLLFQYVALRTRELLMESYVCRVFQIGDVLQNIRQCIQGYLEDPGSLEKIRLLQSEAMHEIINLQEVLSHLDSCLDSKSPLLGDLSSNKSAPSTAHVPAGIKRQQSSRKPRTSPKLNKSSNSLRADSVSALEMSQLINPNSSNSITPDQKNLRLLSDFEADLPSRVHKLSVDAMEDEVSESGMDDSFARRMEQALNVHDLYHSLKLRCVDMQIHLKGNRSELDSLRHMTNYIGEQEAYRLQNQMQVNTRNLEDVFRANERSSSSLEIMQIILAGSLAFDILDRIATLYLSTPHGSFATFISERIVAVPMLWFILNIIIWFVISGALLKFMRHVATKAMGVVTVRLTINIPIHLSAMEKMIREKNTLSENLEREDTSQIVQCVYWDSSDVWSGETVKIDISYDTSNSHLLKAYIQVPRGSDEVSTSKVELAFFAELRRHGVLIQPAADIHNSPATDIVSNSIHPADVALPTGAAAFRGGGLGSKRGSDAVAWLHNQRSNPPPGPSFSGNSTHETKLPGAVMNEEFREPSRRTSMSKAIMAQHSQQVAGIMVSPDTSSEEMQLLRPKGFQSPSSLNRSKSIRR